MKKLLFTLLLALVFSNVATAETVLKEERYSSFNSIEIRNNFNVILNRGDSYSVRAFIDDRVKDYCRIYLQGNSLVMELDEKSMPRELRNSLRKKDSAPLSLSAEIMVPETAGLTGISLSGASVLAGNGKFNFPQHVKISADDNATLKSFEIKASKVIIAAAKKSNVQVNIVSPDIDVTSNNNAFVSLNVTSGSTSANNTISIDANASSQVSLTGSSATTTIKASGSSKVSLNASATKLTLIGKGNSDVDAHLASIEEADIDMTSSDCWVVPLKKMKIKLSSGAKLTFGGNPSIEINKIANSSVIREADSKQLKALKK